MPDMRPVLSIGYTVIMRFGNRSRLIVPMLFVIGMRVFVFVLGYGGELVVIFVFLGGGVVGVMAGSQCD